MYEPIKKLGQNFLTDTTYSQTMAEALKASQGDDVVEIGPGLGFVTEQLSSYARSQKFSLYVVEIDARFIPKLDDMYTAEQNVIVINQDILEFLPKFTTDKPTRVIGSLPFYITSPIIHSIIKMKQIPESVVLLVQKEVGQKLTSDAPDGSYLSTYVQSFYTVAYLQDVPRAKFNPSPDVDGAIIAFYKKQMDTSKLTLEILNKYEGFLHRAFKNPRKMLNKAFNRDELAKMGIDPNLRPQAVSAQKWFEAFKILFNLEQL